MAFDFSDILDAETTNTTLVVDALNLAFRYKHQGRNDFRYDYQKTVQSLAKSYNCSKVIITADWGSSSYRKEINSEYKQNRKDKFAEQTERPRPNYKHPTLLQSLTSMLIESLGLSQNVAAGRHRVRGATMV